MPSYDSLLALHLKYSRPKQMAYEGFTVFSLNVFQFDVYRVRGVSLIKLSDFDSCLVFLDFSLNFQLDFQKLSRMISQMEFLFFKMR